MYDKKKRGIARVLENIIKLIKVIGLILTKPKRILFLLNLNFWGFFIEVGFFESYSRKMPMDEKGNPIPWVTYAFTWFVKDRLSIEFDVFEFGLGNSTLFYSKYVNSVTSVEHDLDWVNKIREKLPQNAELIHKGLDYNGEYSKSAINSGRKFDIIIVDGRDRVNCVINSLDALKQGGVMILDDAFRPNYSPAIDFMEKSGFKIIDFWGPAPMSFRKKNTTIFYKTHNCLNI